jgi:hypothetical protein
MITLNNNGMGFKSDWYIAKVIVEKGIDNEEKKYEFPCYRWVVSQLVVFQDKGINSKTWFFSSTSEFST